MTINGLSTRDFNRVSADASVPLCNTTTATRTENSSPALSPRWTSADRRVTSGWRSTHPSPRKLNYKKLTSV